MTEPYPFHDNADLIRAFEDAPPRGGMKVPERVLFDLEETRTRALAARRRHSSFYSRHSAFIRLAAVFALLVTATWLLLPSPSPTARVVLTFPGAVISETRPTIAWTSKDKPGQKYDVWILPAEGDHLNALESPTLFKAERVTSPVAFTSMKPGKGLNDTALQPDTDYRVLVCLADAGRMAGVPIRFKVKATAAP